MKTNKRKGFTLVELLAVIVILAIVLIIAVPGVLGIINKTKNNAYESQLKIIKEAARTYVTTSDQIGWKENQTVVNLSDLQGVGLLDQKLIDPRDKKEIKGISVLVTKKGTKITYDIVHSDPSNASYPTYSQAMIPIVYKDGNWVKANPSNENQSWFDYSNQQWANVATVTEDVRQTLLDAPVGTVVPMDKINTMFTWIPRFKYKLWNTESTLLPTNNANLLSDYTIQVEMEGKDTPKSTGTQNGEWLTHPAFTFGDEELSGFWVGKFETGYLGATNKVDAEQSVVDASKIVVKPNVYSWTAVTVSQAYYNAYQMRNQTTTFGISSTNDPHLIRNMEWGATAYLSSSPYGKAGNPQYTNLEKQVRLNNNKGLQTGCGADTQDAPATEICNAYQTSVGIQASTTGNITGVYDMAGGANEYVGSMMENKEKTGYVNTDYHALWPQEELDKIGNERKYVDIYPYSETSKQITNHLGNAMREVGPYDLVENASSWQMDRAMFPFNLAPFLYRGGSWDIQDHTGTMAFLGVHGGAYAGTSYRIVLI